MAASNIVLADAQATPANYTFTPIGPDKNHVFWFECQNGATPLGHMRISYEIRRPQLPQPGQASTGRTFRVRRTMHFPTLQLIDGVYSVSHVARSFIEDVIPEQSTLQARKDQRKFGWGLLGEAQSTALTETLLMPY